MDNDDKLTSRSDETPPDDEAEERAANDAAAGDSILTGKNAPDRSSNTIVFSRAGQAHAASRLESNFGMPDFSYPEHTMSMPDDGPDYDDEASMDADALAAAKTGLEKPLLEGTGWESGGTIERPQSDEAGANQPETTEEKSGARAQRSQATVMPFPGSTVQRSSEPMPSDMLRGGAEGDETEAAASSFGTPDEAAPDFDAPVHDALADAVQSALRNVYGGQTAPAEEGPDMRNYTVAESLRQASEQGHGSELWPDVPSDWREDRREVFREPENEAAGDQTSTESVLDYLYSQRRGDRHEGTVLSANSSLRDFGESDGFSNEWQENPDGDNRGMPGGLRDFGGTTYPGASQRFPQSPERPFTRDGGYRGGAAPTPDWGRPPYLSNPQGAYQRGQYPAPIPAASSESLSAGSPDSGHLLGAAGLGLIGGIALAGVLAVFVFNSFVDESDSSSVTEIRPKVVEQLSSAQAETSQAVVREAPAAAETKPPVRIATAPVEAAAPESRPTPPPAVVTPPAKETANEKLAATNATGAIGAAIPLDIRLTDLADGDESLVSLKGLPSGAKLSTGIDVGGGQWLLPPSRLKDLTVTLPQGATGSFNLEVQLLKDDAQTSLSDPVGFELSVGDKAGRSGASRSSQPDAAKRLAPKTEEAGRLAALPDETPQIETDLLTQLLIRDGNKLMRDGDIAGARRLYEQAATNGNPEAALAMGRSFDPSYFEKLPVKTGKPDPATAFEWYKKALEGGLVTARVKIDGLKQWLQR